jgi:hypothetical protein|nr:MAG TPA: hypothetical protein [Caudoviricetes sp.]DAO84346.1 MAG TPA: hypothetical protein [Caudoviricetes sp.]
MSAVVAVTIGLVLVVAAVPVIVCVVYLACVYGGDTLDRLVYMGLDAGERIEEAIDKAVQGK